MNAPTLITSESDTAARDHAEYSWAPIAAGVLAAVYLVASILIARHRLFWFEELLTVIYSVKPTFAGMWSAFALGTEGLPPAGDFIVRLFAHLPPPLEVAARLPSALAMAAGLLVTFDCARRLTDGLHGLVAVAFLTCSILPYYGYEARPYALFFLISATALWLWMNTDDHSNAAALIVGGVFFAATWVHYYTLLWLAPYTLWEFLQRDTRRVPSRKLIAAYVGVFGALATLIKPILAQYRALGHGFWSPASMRNLASVFADLFPHVLFPLVALIAVAALWANRQSRTTVAPMQPYEQLCWLFALLPLVGFVLGKLATHAFLSRYFIGLLPAFAIGLACLMWRHVLDARVALAAVVLFAGWGLGNELEHVHYAAAVRPVPATAELERMDDMLALEADLPADRFIVLRPGDLLTLETHYYARHPERVVFLLRPGESTPAPQAPRSTGEGRPIQRWTLDELRAHQQAMLVDPAAETVDALRRAGRTLTDHYDGVLDVITLQ